MSGQGEMDGWDAKRIAAECYQDPVLFCKYFLNHLFPSPMPWVHRGFLAILTKRTDFLLKYGELDKIFTNFVVEKEDGKLEPIFYLDETNHVCMKLGRYTLVMAPRGFAKTTLCGVAAEIYDIVYLNTPFTVYVSEAAAHSDMQLGNVKRELAYNERLRAVFGDLVPASTSDKKWTKDQIETNTGICVISRGRGGQIRGLLFNGKRPSKILVDDVEDKEAVSTEDQREKTRAWAYGDLMPALGEVGEQANSTIIALGTLLHPQSLLMTWAADPRWTVVRMGAIDRQGEPLWAANMTPEKLAALKEAYTRAGQLHLYYMEYHNEARSPETQVFKREFFNYGPPDPNESVRYAIYCDPAISPKKTADEAVIRVVGMSDKGRIYVADRWHKRGASPREIVDNYFAMSKKWDCVKHGVESIAYQAALVHLLREEMFRKKHYFEIEAVTHAAKKEDRIIGILLPRYAAGYVFHIHPDPPLEAQLCDYRRGVEDQKDDHPDALAGAVALLDPFAADAAGDTDLSEDQYPPLDEAIGGAFGGAP